MTQPMNHHRIQLTPAERDLVALTTLDIVDITFTPPSTQPLASLLTELVQQVVLELYHPTKGD